MMRVHAVAILVTIFTGLIAAAGAQIFQNSIAIEGLIEKERTNKELLWEVRSDVKELLQRTR